MSYTTKVAKYYDDLFAEKDYKSEVDLIYKLRGQTESLNILDVGCGTGAHAKYLLKDNAQKILGIDIAPDMISAAKQKKLGPQIKFENICVTQQPNRNFDLATSMFNVINHISTLKELKSYFSSIYQALKPKGSFIFDCWNGVAAVRSEPTCTTRLIEGGAGGHFIIKTTPVTDALRGSVKMKTAVSVYHLEELIDEFSYTLKHWLWSPLVLQQLLEESGFVVDNIYQANKKNPKPAGPDDYKIIFNALKP